MIKLKLILLEGITDTLQFKRWFRNSKVVDKDGKPLIVYHWTRFGGFNIFKTDIGSHFGSVASANARRDWVSQHDYPDLKWDEVGTDKWKSDSIIPCFLRIEKPYYFNDLKQGNWTPQIAKAKKNGNDGIYYMNRVETDENRNNYSFIVFSPEQIKSIYNNGQFNPNSEDITKE